VVEVSEDLLDELYTAPPEDFIAARDAAVAAARESGDKPLAQALAKLRRPTVGAWLVNLLVRRQPDLIDQLFALGDQLREAQQAASGAQLRELSQQRRAVVGALATQARSLAAQAGRRQGLPLGEVESTLLAALADPVAEDEVRAAMLTHPLTPGGFGGPSIRPTLTVIRGGKGAALAKAAPKELDREQREAAQQRVAQAETALAEAKDEAAAAAQRHDEASSQAAELADAAAAVQARVDEALAHLNTLQAELGEVRGRLNAANKHLAEQAAKAGRAHLAELAAQREWDAARAALD
jgi:flagellin-like hook-associated protein FlgL